MLNPSPQARPPSAVSRAPSTSAYVAASGMARYSTADANDAAEVLSTDTGEALREAAMKRADSLDEEDLERARTPPSPIGLLAIHLLQMKEFNQSAVSMDLVNPRLRFMMLVSIGDMYKETGLKSGHVRHIREKEKSTRLLDRLPIDEVKHFSMRIPQQVSDPANVLRFGLYSVHLDTKDTAPPELVGEAEVHLHEIIKAMMVIDVVSLRLDGRVVASLDLEFAFMYGSMGFCYSTQLENAAFDASRDLGRSMFPRLTLPEERDGEVLVPMPQHAPAFVPWTCSTVTHWDEQLQRLPPVWPPAAPTQFTESVHAEVRRILTDYVPITSRPDRLAFLRRLIRGTPVREPDEGESGAGDDRPADQHHGSDPGPAQLSTTPTDAGRPQLSERPPAQLPPSTGPGAARQRPVVLPATAAPATQPAASSSPRGPPGSATTAPPPASAPKQPLMGRASKISPPRHIRRVPWKRPEGPATIAEQPEDAPDSSAEEFVDAK